MEHVNPEQDERQNRTNRRQDSHDSWPLRECSHPLQLQGVSRSGLVLDGHCLGWVETVQIFSAVTSLVGDDSLAGEGVHKVAVEMGVSKGPDFDVFAFPAAFLRQVRDKGAADVAGVLEVL